MEYISSTEPRDPLWSPSLAPSSVSPSELRIEHAGGGTATLGGIPAEYTGSLEERARGEVRVGRVRDDRRADVDRVIGQLNERFRN